MLSGAQSSSLWTGWRWLLQIGWIFNIWVWPPGLSFAAQAGDKGDLCDNWNAAGPSCWMSDQDALTISSMAKMYPIAVVSLFWEQDSFGVALRFWLPYHISKRSWTLAILCMFLSSVSVFISKLFCVFVVSNSGSVLAKILILALVNCLTTTILQRISPVVSNCLQPITSQPREIQASTPTPRGMI